MTTSREIFEAGGAQEWHTGGGFMRYRVELDSEHELLICDVEGDSPLPEANEELQVSLSKEDGSIDDLTFNFPDAAAALKWIAEMRATVTRGQWAEYFRERQEQNLTDEYSRWLAANHLSEECAYEKLMRAWNENPEKINEEQLAWLSHFNSRWDWMRQRQR